MTTLRRSLVLVLAMMATADARADDVLVKLQHGDTTISQSIKVDAESTTASASESVGRLTYTTSVERAPHEDGAVRYTVRVTQVKGKKETVIANPTLQTQPPESAAFVMETSDLAIDIQVNPS